MADTPRSPFTGLEKALLRPTRPPAPTPPPQQVENDTAVDQAAAPAVSAPRSLVTELPLPVRPDGRTGVRPNERTLPVRRRLIRHPFEFYEDQVEQLRRLSLEAQLRGEKTSMSEMVRQALDDYLTDRTTKP